MATYNGHQEDSNGNILLPTPHSMAYIEMGATATRAYAKGDLLVFNNQLCQASGTISEGATLTIGTNILTTTLSTQLSNINVYVSNADNKIHFVDHAGADTALPFSKADGNIGGGDGFTIDRIVLATDANGGHITITITLTDPNAKGVSFARGGNAGSNNPYGKSTNVSKMKAMDGRVYVLASNPSQAFKFTINAATGGTNQWLDLKKSYEVW